jgi:hypothetical protein
MAKGKRPVSKRFGKGKNGATLACKVTRRKGKVVGAKCTLPKAPKKRKATKKGKARKGLKKSKRKTGKRKSKR